MPHCILFVKFGFSTRAWLSCSSPLPPSPLTSSWDCFCFFSFSVSTLHMACPWYLGCLSWGNLFANCLFHCCWTCTGHGARTWNMVVVVVPYHCCCHGGSSNCWCKAWTWLNADIGAIIGLHACFHFNGSFRSLTTSLIVGLFTPNGWMLRTAISATFQMLSSL